MCAEGRTSERLDGQGSPTKRSRIDCPSHMAHERPRLVMSVRAGCSRYLLDLLWSTKGAAVLTWPSERKGANSDSRFLWEEEEAEVAGVTAASGWTRARLVGRDELAMVAQSSAAGARASVEPRRVVDSRQLRARSRLVAQVQLGISTRAPARAANYGSRPQERDRHCSARHITHDRLQ